MTNEIVKLEDVQQIADAALRSGIMNLKNSSEAIMKILAGQEMGFGTFASLSGIHIIQGRPVIGANLMAAAVKASPRYDYQIIEHDKTHCVLQFLELRNGQWIATGKSSFSLEDAAEAGLLDKKNKDGTDNNWQKYVRNMLFSRAISNGVRWYCPDLFNGSAVYTEGELVEGSWQEAGPEPHGISVTDLINRYGAAAVMEANGGLAPSEDPEQLQVLAEKLETEYANAV